MREEKITILAIEDNPADLRLLKELLRESLTANFTLTEAQTFKEALGIFASQNFDIVLLDLNLPDGKGVENIDTLSAVKPEIPIVVLTGLEDEKIGITAVQKGAQDYLVKGRFHGENFIKSIRYAIERKRFEERLREKVTARGPR